MKLQDILLPLSAAFLMTWGIQYFFVTRHIPEKDSAYKSGQSARVVPADLIHKPLSTEIDFIDSQIDFVGKDIAVHLPRIQTNVSTAGGVLSSLAFHHESGKEVEWLSTLVSAGKESHQHGALLVACAEKTPYAYELVDQRSNAEGAVVVLRSQTPEVIITKDFAWKSDSYRLDLTLTVEPRSGSIIQPRIFLPAPHFPQEHPEKVMGLLFTDRQVVQKMPVAEVENMVWSAPTLFGAEDRYFIHALVADQDHFVERGYFKVEGTHGLTAIMEGPAITEKTTWKMSFYCGPKRVEDLAAVDKRLEETLDYGWFAPLSKVLLSMLNWIYRYVHNYGFAIILLTIVLRIILIPFTWRNERNAAQRADFARKMSHLEQKYKHDREALAREKLELVRKQGVFSSTLGGCLPMVYLPVFIGLNRVLHNAIDLYHAPFIGWISDLSAKDPYYVLPVVGAAGLLVMQGDQKDPRQFVAMGLMALLVAGITANLSAGLTLFLCVSTFAGIAQTKIQRMLKW